VGPRLLTLKLFQTSMSLFVLLNTFIPVMALMNFQQPLLQCSVSHDLSETILIIIIITM